MLSSDNGVVKAIMEIRLREALARAEIELLLGQSCGEPEDWLARQVCRLLRQVGRRLVAWGQRLERIGLARDLRLKQDPGSCCGV
jgi:hypothetical protein